MVLSAVCVFADKDCTDSGCCWHWHSNWGH